MDQTTLISWIIPVVTAALGFFGGLCTPWIKWSIEKRRMRLEERKKIVSDCYRFLEQNGDRADFYHSPEFSRIKPYLIEKNIKHTFEDIYAIHIVHLGPDGHGPYEANSCLRTMYAELSRLEKKWGFK